MINDECGYVWSGFVKVRVDFEEEEWEDIYLF